MSLYVYSRSAETKDGKKSSARMVIGEILCLSKEREQNTHVWLRDRRIRWYDGLNAPPMIPAVVIA